MALNNLGVGEFCDFRPKSPFYLRNSTRKPVHYESLTGSHRYSRSICICVPLTSSGVERWDARVRHYVCITWPRMTKFGAVTRGEGHICWRSSTPIQLQGARHSVLTFWDRIVTFRRHCCFLIVCLHMWMI